MYDFVVVVLIDTFLRFLCDFRSEKPVSEKITDTYYVAD